MNTSKVVKTKGKIANIYLILGVIFSIIFLMIFLIMKFISALNF